METLRVKVIFLVDVVKGEELVFEKICKRYEAQAMKTTKQMDEDHVTSYILITDDGNHRALIKDLKDRDEISSIFFMEVYRSWSVL